MPITGPAASATVVRPRSATRSRGPKRVYFAGDTDLFPGMRDLGAAGLDVALVPIWGWGAKLGSGHLDPVRAAESLALLKPRVAIPIHWGTFFAMKLRRFRYAAIAEPARAFVRAAGERAPEVDVRVLAPAVRHIRLRPLRPCENGSLGSSAMADRPPEGPRRSEQTRSILLGALILLAILFALLNLDKVEVDLIFGSPRIPLIIVIVGLLRRRRGDRPALPPPPPPQSLKARGRIAGGPVGIMPTRRAEASVPRS